MQVWHSFVPCYSDNPIMNKNALLITLRFIYEVFLGSVLNKYITAHYKKSMLSVTACPYPMLKRGDHSCFVRRV